MTAERIQKVLARAGVGSRRSCDELVAAGRVRVNGEIAELGAKVDPAKDTVEVDGVPVSLDPNAVYLAFHKPTGVVTTARDPQRRPTVVDYVPSDPRVFPVGRLDIDTSGLLLLTNDGDFANRMTHPRYEVPKTYLADVAGSVRRGQLATLRKGIDLEDGRAWAKRVRVTASVQGRSLVELTVHEGRNRMVRRMFEALDLNVLALVRIAIGPIGLGDLREGRWRHLQREEVLSLLREADPSRVEPNVD